MLHALLLHASGSAWSAAAVALVARLCACEEDTRSSLIHRLIREPQQCACAAVVLPPLLELPAGAVGGVTQLCTAVVSGLSHAGGSPAQTLCLTQTLVVFVWRCPTAIRHMAVGTVCVCVCV